MKKKIGILITVVLLGIWNLTGCRTEEKNEVVVYTAVDEIFSDKIIRAFEAETGIRVKVVYDTEANKTTGLVNRILAEKSHPICDVFWNNEFIQTIELGRQGILEAYESPSAVDIPDYYKSGKQEWTAVGGRARVFLVNNELLGERNFPKSVMDFINGTIPGEQLAIAYPMFGTTRTMAAAFYAQWGEETGRTYFEKIVDSGVNVVDGNSVTKDMAADGRVIIGFTDSDDAREAIQDGADVTMVFPDQEDGEMGTLITPSTVALIKGAPNQENAKKFIDYILREDTERTLVADGFYDLSIRDAGKEGSIKGMDLSLEQIYECMAVSSADMEELFSRAY